MSDDFDPGLRRLFAETVESPADEAFVAGVTARTSRERRLRLLGRALAGLVILAASLAVTSLGLETVLSRGFGRIALLASASPPVGLALVLAGAVYVRAVGPLFSRMRA